MKKTWEDYIGIEDFDAMWLRIRNDCLDEMKAPFEAGNPSGVNIAIAVIRKYNQIWNDLCDHRPECKKDGLKIDFKRWILEADFPDDFKRAAAYL